LKLETLNVNMMWVLSHPVVFPCSIYHVGNAIENIKLIKKNNDGQYFTVFCFLSGQVTEWYLDLGFTVSN